MSSSYIPSLPCSVALVNGVCAWQEEHNTIQVVNEYHQENLGTHQSHRKQLAIKGTWHSLVPYPLLSVFLLELKKKFLGWAPRAHSYHELNS